MKLKLSGTLYEEQTINSKNHYDPFIYTDLLTTFVGQHPMVIGHFWEMTPHVILGMKDTRVTDLQKGVAYLKSQNFDVVVRNSGGLAVVSDPGILNFSLIFPHLINDEKLSINFGYECMTEIIQHAFKDQTDKIMPFEVPDSYCPGDFDLSINGQKFAGIAQRRVKDGISVMIYLSVNGDQPKRGKLIREFYQASLDDHFGTDGYPPVRADSMANLSDLLNLPLTINDVKKRISTTMNSYFSIEPLVNSELSNYLDSSDWQADYQKQFERMIKRNEIIQAEGV